MNDLLLSLNYLKYAYTMVTAKRAAIALKARSEEIASSTIGIKRQKRFKSVDLKELLKSLIVMRFLHCSVQARGLPC